MSDVLEVAGVALGLLYLILVIREQRSGWIAGGLASLLFLFVFWQAKLPSQAVLQIYYVAIAAHGWMHWGAEKATVVQRLSAQRQVLLLMLLAVLSAITLAFRQDFSFNASLDALSSWGGAIATWMVARKYAEAWLWWVVIDSATVVLYISAGLLPTAALYVVYTVLAAYGLWEWLRSSRQATPGD